MCITNLINRTSVSYNGKTINHDDKSLSDIERKLLFTSVLDYTRGGIVNAPAMPMPPAIIKYVR